MYGFRDECGPFIKPEREQNYEFEVGYIKGASEQQADFTFQIEPIFLTACKQVMLLVIIFIRYDTFIKIRYNIVCLT